MEILTINRSYLYCCIDKSFWIEPKVFLVFFFLSTYSHLTLSSSTLHRRCLCCTAVVFTTRDVRFSRMVSRFAFAPHPQPPVYGWPSALLRVWDRCGRDEKGMGCLCTTAKNLYTQPKERAGMRIRSETSLPNAAVAATAVDNVSGLPGWPRARFIVIRMTVSVCSWGLQSWSRMYRQNHYIQLL